MKSFFKKLLLALGASAFLFPAPLVLAATAPSAPPAIDVSKLTPEQKAIYDKLTPAQKEMLLKPPPLPAGAVVGVVSTSTQTTVTNTSPATPNSGTVPAQPASTSTNSTPLYVLIGIGVLVLLGLGSFLVRRRNNSI